MDWEIRVYAHLKHTMDQRFPINGTVKFYFQHFQVELSARLFDWIMPLLFLQNQTSCHLL